MTLNPEDRPYVFVTKYRVRSQRHIFGTYDYEFEKYILSDGNMYTADELSGFAPIYLTEDDLIITIRYGLHKQEGLFED